MQQIGLDATITNVPDFTRGIDSMNKAVDGFAQNSASEGGAFSKGFGEMVTGALREVGTLAVDALLKAGQAVAGFVKSSISVAGDFEQGFAGFQVAVGHTIDDTGLKLDDFKKLFISLGKELPVSTQEVETAATEMARGGIDPAVIAAGGLKRTIQFAAAALKGDLVQAAQISAKTMQAWTSITDSAAAKTDFLTHAQNLMTQATTAASTTVDQLFLGLSNVGGTARLAGVSFDETVKALAQLTPSFASSADAGTSLKTFFARLQPETKPAIAAMRDLGLYTDATGSAFYDAQGKFVGMQAAEDLLQKATSGLTDAQRSQALQQIFGNDAIRAAGVFALQGQAGYDALSTSISKQTTLTDAAAINQNTYNTAVENAKGSVEALQITVDTALIPILTDLMNNTIAPAINTVTSFAESFLKMVPAIQASDDPFKTFMLAIAVAAPGLTDLVFKILAFTDSLKPAIAEFGKLADAFSSGGLGGLIDTLKTDITAALPDIQKALLGWGKAFVDWVGPMIPPVLTELGKLIVAGTGWVAQQEGAWLKQLATWGQTFVTWIAPMIPPFLVELGRLGTQLLGWISDQAAPLLAKFVVWKDSFIAWIGPATVTFLAEWPKMLDQFLNWIGNAAGPILKQLGEWAVSFVAWVIPMLPGFLLEVGKIALAIGVFIVETVVVINKKVLDWAIAITAWVGAEAIPRLLKALAEMWSNINTWGLKVESDIGTLMTEVGNSVVQGIKKGIEDAWGSFVKWISDKIASIPGVGQAAQKGGSPAMLWAPVGQSIVEGIMQGLSDAWPALTDQIGGMVKDLTSKMQDIGKNIQSAIADSFGATASIDRQVVKNMDSLNSVAEGFYRTATVNALRNAQQVADQYADPTIGAKFFKMRSDQIFEFQALQEKINAETDADTKARLQQQQTLILKAQEAEQAAFDTQNTRTQSPALDIAKQINDIMNAISGTNLTDAQIHVIDQLASMFGALSTPVGPYGRTNAGQNVYSQQTNLNMPIYTSQSPSVMQDSMAVARAALL